MSIEQEIRNRVDPFHIFEYIKNVKVIYEGLIINPKAKNLLTGKSMFLSKGLKAQYDYALPVGYDPPGYEYFTGISHVYMTSKQFVMLCLK